MGISVQRTVQHNETTGGPFWRLRTYDPKRFDRACMYISHRNFIWPLWRHSRFQLVPSRTKASVSQADISIGASPIDPGRRGPEGNELHPHPIRSAGKLLERWTFCGFSCTSKSEYPAADSHQLAVPRKGKSDAADARRPPVQAEVCINDGKKGAERVHLAQSSSGRLFRHDPVSL